MRLGLVTMTGFCMLATAFAADAQGGAAAERDGPMERETARLAAELELARGKGFYLELDARSGRLVLLLEGVPLAEYPVTRLERGVPRLLFLSRAAPHRWELAAHRGGRLEPSRERERLEVDAPAPETTPGSEARPTPPGMIPPTAEESYSVPARYRIAFDGGVAIEVTARRGGRNRSWARRLADATGLHFADIWNALRPEPRQRVRLRIELDPEAAAALYRSLPPDVGLVVAGLPAG